jgi:Holliday junction resolvase RusA-like endonuclease
MTTRRNSRPEPIPHLCPKPGPGEIARFKRAILKAWHSHLSKTEKPKTKELATMEYCQLVNSGLLLPEAFSKTKHVSKSTLHSWNKKYRDHGLGGLTPRWKYKWKEKPADNLVPMLPSYEKITILGNPILRFKPRVLWPEVKRQWKWPPLRCPIMLVMFFSMEIPKGFPMDARMKLLRHEFPHLGPPHLDRLIAFVKDCLRGIVYTEDRQVICLHGEVHYSWAPKTEIYIRRLKG